MDQKKATKRKLSEEDKNWWTTIFRYVEKEILSYDDNQRLQKQAVLRLKGLETGNVVANNNIENNGNYPLEVVYGAIVLSRPKYLEAKRNKKFDTESNAIAYFCAIVRSQLNTVYATWKARQHQLAISGSIKEEEPHAKAAYKPKPTRKALANVSGGFW